MSEEYKDLARAFRNAQVELKNLRTDLKKLQEPIAIVSMACRFPGKADSPESYWKILDEGKNVIEEIPQERWEKWNVSDLYDPNPNAVGKTYCKTGGFLENIDYFDANFFEIAPREMFSMDPQQRLVLEIVWETLERAGILPYELNKTKTGVYIGAIASDSYQQKDLTELDGYTITGKVASVISGRVAYTLGLEGPAITVDTACSSSLVALHLACQALRIGECDLALAGGVQLITSPVGFVEFSRLKASSPDGKCKSFSALADGAGWSEGCGILLLKRLSDAQKDGNKILALIKGSAINQDGRSQGLTAPNGPSQVKVVKKALEMSGLTPSEIDAIEAHGTGTTLGDPIEAGALAEVFSLSHKNTRPVYLGSSKSNIGHSQAAAGAASIIKMVLALQNEKLPKTLYSEQPSPYIKWEGSGLELLTEAKAWLRGQQPRRCGISSFGISGTNAHIILEEAPEVLVEKKEPTQEKNVLLISGQTQEALKAQAKQYSEYIELHPEISLEDLCYSAAFYRTHFLHRACILAINREETVKALKEFSQTFASPLVNKAESLSGNCKVVFVYPGQGSQWLGMGKELLKKSAIFREIIAKCDKEISKEANFSVIEELLAKPETSRLKEIEVVQPVLFAMAVALTAMWKEFGVNPDIVVGHSQGEVAAAYIAGALSLEDAVKIVCRRSQIVKQITGLGLMAMIELTTQETKDRIEKPLYKGKLSIAVSNSPNQTVVSGETQAIEQLIEELENEKIFCRKIQVDYASHSPQIETLKTELLEKLSEIKTKTTEISFISTVKKQVLDGTQLDAQYWYENLRETVNFAEVIEKLWLDSECVMIEQSSHPLLTLSMEQIRNNTKARGVVIHSLKREQPQIDTLFSSIGLAHCAGVKVNWAKILTGAFVELPTYPFQRQKYWPENKKQEKADVKEAGLESTDHPFLGAITLVAEEQDYIFSGKISLEKEKWLLGHKVFDTVLLPGTGFLELAWTVGQSIGATVVEELTLFSPLVLIEKKPRQIQIKVEKANEDGKSQFTVYSREENLEDKLERLWNKHAKGILSKEEIKIESREELGEWPPIDAQPIEITGLYDKFKELKLDYGTEFQGLKEVWLKNDYLYAKVELKQQTQEADKYKLHPALLDAALHTIFFANLGTKEKFVKIPFRWTGAKLYAVGAKELYLRMRVREDEIEMSLYDIAGQLLAEIENLSLRKAENEQIKASVLEQTQENQHLYTLKWQVVKTEAIFDDNIVDRLEDYILLGKDNLSNELGIKTITSIEALKEYLSKTKEAPKALIINLINEKENVGELATKAIAQTEKTLLQIQELLKIEQLQKTKLIWITQQAVSVGVSDKVEDLSNTPIWGFIRSVRNEYIDRQFQLIDIDSQTNENQLINSFSLSESEIAIRSGAILIPQLQNYKTSQQKTALAEFINLAGTTLITGGLGEIGSVVAKHLVTNYKVKNLVLTSRKASSSANALLLKIELEKLGAKVEIAECDVADYQSLKKVIDSIEKNSPLKAVIHCAGVLEDAIVVEQNKEKLDKVLLPKVAGAWNLHKLTKDLDLELFIMMSSFAGIIGSPGQSNYAAANAFLDSLASYRQNQGLPAQSLAWGFWKQQGYGMTSSLTDVDIARIKRQGLEVMTPQQALALFDSAISSQKAFLVTAYINLSASSSITTPALLRGMVKEPKPRASTKGQIGNVVLRQQLAKTPEKERLAVIMPLVNKEIAMVLALSNTEALVADQPLKELGLDSLMAVELRTRLSSKFSIDLPSTFAFDYPTPKAIATFLLEKAFPNLNSAEKSLSPVKTKMSIDEPIAIISMACRLPGDVFTPEDYWQVLDKGQDVVDKFPNRWNVESIYDSNPESKGKTYCKEGGFLKEIDKFDANFFGISPREAQAMDPQQRLLLETSWEALERAAILPEKIKESLTGIFIGQMYSDYGSTMTSSPEELDGYVGTGSAASVSAGRIAYVFGLQGPTMTIDTACSSSLVSIHLACQALRARECNLALAGGVAIMASPAIFIEFSRLKGLAPDGRCKSFSALADGAGWSEGCGIILLKRLSDAQKDGNKILAVIKGSVVNQDGRSQGLTAPNGPSQTKLIKRALEISGLKPSEIDAIEAHGTGTTLGDPIEANSLIEVFSSTRLQDKPLYLGSSKSNIGHTQAAAGVVGVIKMILALQNKRLPKTLYSEQPSPYIKWEGSGLELLTEAKAWLRGQQPRRCGISSFGISGTNAHIILEEAPEVLVEKKEPTQEKNVLLISGQTQEALKAQAKQYSEYIELHPEISLEDLCYSAAFYRTHFLHRACILAINREETVKALKEFSQTFASPLVNKAESLSGNCKVVFVYPGQGSQWLGMGKELLKKSAIFREIIAKCDKEISKEANFSVIEELLAKPETSRLKEIEVVQPVLFAMAVALTAMWKEFGVNPDIVVGHSQGEVAAAYIAGALSLEDAVKIVCRRSQIVKQITGLGLMAMIELTTQETKDRIEKPLYKGKLSIAVSNSPNQTVVSGETQAIEQLIEELENEKIFCRKIQVDYASHSPQIETLKTELLEKLSEIKTKTTEISFISTVKKQVLDGTQLDAQYWYENLRETVNFAEVIEKLWLDSECVMIEQSSHPLLTLSMEQIRNNAKARGVVIHSLKREQPQIDTLFSSIGLAHCAGVKVNWTKILTGAFVELPTYPFQRQKYWLESEKEKSIDISLMGLELAKHPLLGAMTQLADGGYLFTASLSLKEHHWLEDHKVFGSVILPATGYLELAWRAGELLGINSVSNLMLINPIVLSKDTFTQLQLKVKKEDEANNVKFAFYTKKQTDDSWLEHSVGGLSETEEKEVEKLGEWPPLNSQNLDLKEFYSKIEKIGISYGISFQCLKEIYSKQGVIYSRVELGKEQEKEAEKYAVHPALLDAALQSIFFFSELKNQQNTKLPFQINGATLYAKGAKELYVRLREKDEEIIEVSLFDSTGLLVAQLDELVVKIATPEQIKQASKAQTKHLYKISWKAIALKGEITKLENTVVLGKSKLAQTLGLPSFESVDKLFLSIKDSSSPKQIIMDTTSFIDETLENELLLPNIVIENSQRVLQDLQKLLQEENFSQTKLTLITKQAIATSSDDVILGLAYSSIYGLIRTAINEYPNRHIHLIDIAENTSKELLLESLAEEKEKELAIRINKILVPRLVSINKTDALTISQETKNWNLRIENRGTIEAIKIASNPDVERHLVSGEVRIEVKACGLNFRDVLGVLGMLLVDPGPIGFEGAGVVVEVADDVTSLNVGDKVMGLLRAGASNQAISLAKVLVKMPSNLSFRDGATIALNFLTAYYALFDLGKLKEGEKILIHAATGATGMAAVQLAKMVGAEVFVTASPSKWNVLYKQGFAASHIASSRTLDFEKHFFEQTQGNGMDVVLNSLTKEYIDASLRLLPRGGRFLDMGKIDIRDSKVIANNYIGVEYQALDLMDAGADRISEILKELAKLLEEEKLRPLPYETYDIREAQSAFRYMANAHHIGKLLLIPPQPLRLKGTVLITGGTGEIGALLAEHLVKEYGVKNLLLTSRKGLNAPNALELKTKLEKLGANVEIKACDVSNYKALKDLIDALSKETPLVALLHTVGVLDDGVLTEQTPQRFTNVMSAKVLGAWNLHELTKNKDLELFVLFSSLAGITGSSGQANYAAANTFLDSLAHYRKKMGLAGQSLAWGFWQQQGTGMTSHLGNAEIARLKRQGLDVITSEQGLKLFDQAILQAESLLVPTNFNLPNLAQNTVPLLLSEILNTKTLRKVSPTVGKKDISLKQSLKYLSEKEQFSKLLSIVCSEIAVVLALPDANLIPVEKPLQELGLDSLMAIEIRNRLSAISAVDLPTTTVLRFPTIHSLTSEIFRLIKQDIGNIESPDLVINTKDEEKQPVQLKNDINKAKPEVKALSLLHPQEVIASPSQQRLWFLDQVLEQKETYHVYTSFKINRSFDVEVLQKVFEMLITRHEQLRVCFKEQNGVVKQRVLPWVEADFETYNLIGLNEVQQQETISKLLNDYANKPFNLRKAPLFRVFIASLSQNQSVVCAVFHHIIIDGTSVGIFLEELFLLYEAEIRNTEVILAPAPSYLVYSQALNSWLETSDADKQRAYWKNQLKGLEALSLPTNKNPLGKENQEGDLVSFNLTLELCQKINKLASEKEITPFVLFSTAWSILLSCYSGQKDFAFGTFTSGRKVSEIEKAIGFFVNTLPIRCNLEDNPTLSAYIAQLQETIWSALDNQDLPYNEIVQVNTNSREFLSGGLFNTSVVLEEENWVKSSFGDYVIEHFTNSFGTLETIALFPLNLSVIHSNNVYRANIDFLIDLFEKSTIERMAKHFLNILEEIVANPQKRLSELEIVTLEERNKLLFEYSLSQGKSSFTLPVYALFEQQVKIFPNNIAVLQDAESLTYSELNVQANQLAHYLKSVGIGSGKIVALFIERSIKLIISILGILKTGAAYLPLDTNLPTERIKFILEDSQPHILLTDSSFLYNVEANHLKVVNIKEKWEHITQQNQDNLPISLDLEDLAYIIYTSGSTGLPKGVMISHSALTSFVESANLVYKINNQDTVLQFAPISFDLSVEEIFVSLTNGAKLVLRSSSMLDSMEVFFSQCQALGISVLDLPTAFWHEMVNSLATKELTIPKSLRLVIIGGEKALNNKLATWQKEVGTNIRLINTYGPTETTVVALFCELTDLEINTREIPIGRPLLNTQVYILDSYGKVVPIGVAGELHIAGKGLAKGYLNRPDLTTEKFIPNPFSTEPNSNLYKTGDLVRWLENADIEFIGRVDSQVKIRGFRVELGEIENAIAQYPSIKECVVQLKGEESENKLLVAYLVAKNNESNQLVKKLRTYLKTKLPDYMIPSIFLLLEALPLNSNGKIDHKALSKLSIGNLLNQQQSKTYVAPMSAIENTLVEVWQETLGIDNIGIYDNFFALGGNSLKTIKLVALASKKGIEVSSRDVFVYPTIAELAKSLGDEKPKSCVNILRKGSTIGTVVYIPGAGGTLFDAPILANELKSNSTIVGLTIPTLAGLGQMPNSLEDLCALYVNDLAIVTSPFVLIGHSFGGAIAIELAKQLQEAKRDVRQVIMLDSWLPEIVPTLSRKESLVELASQFNLDINLTYGEDEIFNQIVDFLEFEKLDSLDPQTWLNLIFDAIEAVTNMCKAWKPKQISSPIHLLRASKTPEIFDLRDMPIDLGWSKYINLSSSKEVIGDHFSILRKPYVIEIAQIINNIV